MKVTRIFHPVGQGGFYTESFDDQHMVVYDCGSESEKKLQNYLNDCFREAPKQTIDVVFLSHLHSDHINGLQELRNRTNVKKIFLPLLTSNKIVEAILYNKANFSYYENKRANEIIQSLLSENTSDTRLIEVEEFRANTISDGDTYDIDHENMSIRRIASGTKITLELPPVLTSNNTYLKWVYIPFNIELPEPSVNRSYVDKITNETVREEVLSIATNIMQIYEAYYNQRDILTKELIKLINSRDYDDYLPIDREYIDEFYKSQRDGVYLFKKVYSALFGNIDNSQSMPVFSGLLKENLCSLEMQIKSNILCTYCSHCHDYFSIHHCMVHSYLCEDKIPCNFLYTGDYEAQNINFFKCLKDFYENYRVWDTLCGLQIPHHGSRKNYNTGLYQDKCFAIASVGVNNRHKHPNIDTLINITNQGCCPNVVTEDINTLKYQHFNIK